MPFAGTGLHGAFEAPAAKWRGREPSITPRPSAPVVLGSTRETSARRLYRSQLQVVINRIPSRACGCLPNGGAAFLMATDRSQGGEPVMLIAAETLYSSHYFYARLQLLGVYTDSADPKLTYALYGDRLLFDDSVGSIQRKILRKSAWSTTRGSDSAMFARSIARHSCVSRPFLAEVTT